MRIAVVSAGLSVPSATRLLAERLAAATVERTGAEPRFVELRELAVAIAHHLTSGFPGPRLAEAIEEVTGADGLIAVTPVFSASYSGLFKSFFDLLEPEALAGKPVLIAATGGTPRHSLVIDHALRPLFAYARAIVPPTGVYAASQDWGASRAAAADELAARIERAAGELAGLLRPGSPAPRRPEGERAGADGAGAVVDGAGAGERPPQAPEPDGEFVPFAERLAALGIDAPPAPGDAARGPGSTPEAGAPTAGGTRPEAPGGGRPGR
ncbi:oxidoreductase [Streptomyces hoynatensis]|uniref:Oxidoreductase n=1 Tax=Streptomyces hoynatensis TaxID=1141874 RepID=A0A3A9ZAZ0_9ACTN|nr:oxidoreductase [Streptomyces hoynatensis]